MLPLLLALLLPVEVLGLLHLQEIQVQRGREHFTLRARGDRVELTDTQPQPHTQPQPQTQAQPQPQAPRQPPALAPSLTLAAPSEGLLLLTGKLPPRRLPGPLTATARDSVLHLVASLPLEPYVAGVVEAELPAGALPAAAEALAIAVRSFALRRAKAGHLCDQTHCQVFRGAARTALAREAAAHTAGQVLLLPTGAVAPALHHAACGGRTAGAEEVWPYASEEERLAGTSVEDLLPEGTPACAASRGPGRSSDPPLSFQVVVAATTLAKALGAEVPLSLSIETGRDGWVRKVQAKGLPPLGPESLHLALGRALGWDVVRSPRLRLRELAPAEHAAHPGSGVGGAGVAGAGASGARYLVEGTGHGHGVGLCQRGAALRAARGETAAQLLARYFPQLRVGAIPEAPGPRPTGSPHPPDARPKGSRALPSRPDLR